MNKKSISIVMVSIIIGCNADGIKNSTNNDENEIPALPGYDLIWQDEFSGDIIDTSKWEFEVNAWGGGNNELQYYTDRIENAYVDSGNLVIKAIHATYTDEEGTRDYTSARMRTRNKGDWLYGRFEICAKLPQGQGLWPAIWMLPTDWEYGGWASSGEIDIMELLGHEPDKTYGTLHYGGTWPDNVHTGENYTLPEGDFTNEFHVFGFEWEETEMRWYIDDVHFATQTVWHTIAADYPAPFDKRFHLLLNIAVGGNWPGNPDESTIFPQEMVVDYIRVFQKVDD
ncbi:MAG: glycoside hydrolase family 16 protein [Candidatus Marinimicrobia bacterium]|nr:glycoside hydrolase family 16 protein [Candidatus Neomarinimicrobiota bacterium]